MTTGKLATTGVSDERLCVSLSSILLAHLQLGLTAFGFAILQKLKALVLGMGWLTEDGIALSQITPGPFLILATFVLQLGNVGVTGPASMTMAAAAFIAVRYFKLDILWVFAGGLVLWSILLAIGLI